MSVLIITFNKLLTNFCLQWKINCNDSDTWYCSAKATYLVAEEKKKKTLNIPNGSNTALLPYLIQTRISHFMGKTCCSKKA